MKDILVNFLKDEEGLETIEMVIILVVLVGIAFAFRKTLLNWYTKFITESVSTQSVGVPVSPTAPGTSQ